MRRLTFTVRDGAIELVSDQRVDMKAVPAPPPTAARAGFWCEVRDHAGTVLAAAAAPDPAPSDREVFSPDPGRSVQRVPGTSAPTAFSVVVPDAAGAESVSLMRAAGGGGPDATGAHPASAAPAVVEVARFELRTEND